MCLACLNHFTQGTRITHRHSKAVAGAAIISSPPVTDIISLLQYMDSQCCADDERCRQEDERRRQEDSQYRQEGNACVEAMLARLTGAAPQTIQVALQLKYSMVALFALAFLPTLNPSYLSGRLKTSSVTAEPPSGHRIPPRATMSMLVPFRS